ncbi:hypothetical protein HX109_01060 [Galbibacter sp. BG1]|uniref:hypothetical protein n=1 Tax=Galbibacter sp. BG1 TaxID=1170699 RepID=UPI0015BCAD38|nr:hypothetical protein [Galbibacter sp. BG1]QLE00219.1 hypothetical protein HX109_01060 [Galbibacter sp. BG1]
MKNSLRFALIFCFAGLVLSCASTVDNIVTNAISAPLSDIRVYDILMPMPNDPHMAMTKKLPEQDGDQRRADSLVEVIEKNIIRFKDIDVAKEEGYEFFPPEPPADMNIVHLVHRKYSEKEMKKGFNSEKPGSILYERDGNGWKLIGAMITAPVDASKEELNDLAPLSVTQWHLHQKVCVPKPIWDKEEWQKTFPDGTPVYGPTSSIASKSDCEKFDGTFLPVVFGWMTHAYVYLDNPNDVWNQMYGHDHGGHHGNHSSMDHSGH